MAIARTWSVALDGVTGHLVQIEADLAAGLPATIVIGLGDVAVNQARERVRAAVRNSGRKWPEKKVTLALSPAALPKKGAGFDLAIAVAVLEAAEELPAGRAESLILLGELGLDGEVRPVRGVLPQLLAARNSGRDMAIVPLANLAEAALSGLLVHGVANLDDLLGHLAGQQGRLVDATDPVVRDHDPVPDLVDVVGQVEARAALEVAAAGGHHLAMIGPPGAGKTMLAARLPGLLPALGQQWALEVTAVHSVAGLLAEDAPLITRPPFIDPHHTASMAAIIGGGSSHIRPGSVSLAHQGVLFLDEAPEFKPTVLDGLRQPLESGKVLLARANGAVRFPARFQLVLAANPCPCAAARDIDCCCASGVRRRYLGRLSGPLLDRVDIRVDLPPLDPAAIAGVGPQPESTATVAERVQLARGRAAVRWRGSPWRLNADVPGPQVRRYVRARRVDTELVDQAVRAGRLTGRGYDRVLRLALTSADLGGRDNPSRTDIGRALALRCGEGL